LREHAKCFAMNRYNLFFPTSNLPLSTRYGADSD
jgi:hypothetical protein